MTAVNSAGSSQPSTPNKTQSYSEYMLSLQHKLATISNSGPVSPQSPLEYSPALSPTHRGIPQHKAEGAEDGAHKARHVAQLADLDHELSKISLHYKHAPPKDVFIDHGGEGHEMLGANLNDNAVNQYEDLGVGVGVGAGAWDQLCVSRAAPCRGYSLCRLLPNHLATAKDKLEILSQSHTFTNDAALDELSNADNNSSYEEASGGGSGGGGGGETYVITHATRARTYVVTDALGERTSTIIDPTRGGEVEVTKASEECDDPDRSYLIVDSSRSLTCTVIDRSLDLAADPHFAPFREAKYTSAGNSPTGATATPASEELSKWRSVEVGGGGGAWREGASVPRAAVTAAADAAPRVLRVRRASMAADLVITHALTDNALCRQLVVVTVSSL
ncbi:hypothetical protein O0L34_g10879 [Tuta absoluta]|nr:hypothetical protein O0L34_g10879 [Tuta absoluta]